MAGNVHQEKSKPKAMRKNFVREVVGTVFSIAQLAGLMQFNYCVKTGRLIDSPRYVFRLIVISVAYLCLIAYYCTKGESVSVTGDQSKLFNTGIAILTSASYLFSLSCLIITFITRKQITKLVTLFIRNEEEVGGKFTLIVTNDGESIWVR